jgi:hypothetical protein
MTTTGTKLKTRRDYRTKPRFEGDPGSVVRVTKLEQWRGGWWAHVRFPDGDRNLMMHTDDLERSTV